MIGLSLAWGRGGLDKARSRMVVGAERVQLYLNCSLGGGGGGRLMEDRKGEGDILMAVRKRKEMRSKRERVKDINFINR